MTARRHGLADLPPMPADPMVCRWCRCGRLKLPNGHLYCKTGCSANHLPYVRAVCQDCDREFDTGRPLREAVLCHQCDTREEMALCRDYAAQRRRYEFSALGRGGLRD